MNTAKPPGLAAWILLHFGPQQNNDALAGDLWEDFEQGRSKAWYWRQVLAAVQWRRHLFALLFFAGLSWWWSSPVLWRHSSLRVSRPLNMAIFTAILLAGVYLPGMLRGIVRAAFVLCIVAMFLLVLRYDSALAWRYGTCAWILVCSLIFYRKGFSPPPPYHLTLREVIKGDPDQERKRMITSLEQTLEQETNPELRQVYAQSISVLESPDHSPNARGNQAT